jgi:hypothetical protein
MNVHPHGNEEMIEKNEYDVNSVPTEHGVSDDSLSDRHQGTYHDVRDMGRLGKKQEFMVPLPITLTTN